MTTLSEGREEIEVVVEIKVEDLFCLSSLSNYSLVCFTLIRQMLELFVFSRACACVRCLEIIRVDNRIGLFKSNRASQAVRQ